MTEYFLNTRRVIILRLTLYLKVVKYLHLPVHKNINVLYIQSFRPVARIGENEVEKLSSNCVPSAKLLKYCIYTFNY